MISAALIGLSVFLFRRASLQPRWRPQMGWLAGALFAGVTAVALPGTGAFFLIVAILGALLACHLFVPEPEPERFFARALYHSGFAYLFAASFFAARAQWAGALVVTVLYIAGYLASRHMTRDYGFGD